MRQDLLFRHNGQWHQRTTRPWIVPIVMLTCIGVTLPALYFGWNAAQTRERALKSAAAADTRLERQLKLSGQQQAMLTLLRADLRDGVAELRAVQRDFNEVARHEALAPPVRAELLLWQKRVSQRAQSLQDKLLTPQATLLGLDDTRDDAGFDAGLVALEEQAATVPAAQLRMIATQTRLRARVQRAEASLRAEKVLSSRVPELRAEIATLKGTVKAQSTTLAALAVDSSTESSAANQAVAETSSVASAAAYFSNALDAAQAREAELSLALTAAKLSQSRVENDLLRAQSEQRLAVEALENYTSAALGTAKDMLIYMGLSSAKLSPQIETLKSRGAPIGDREMLPPKPTQREALSDGPAGRGGPFEAIAGVAITDFSNSQATGVLDGQIAELRQLQSNIRQLDYYRLLIDTVPTLRPIPDRSKKLSSTFGTRTDPINGRKSFHRGIDYEGDKGDPVVATGDGVVIKSRTWAEYGNFVEVLHIKGLTTRYAHLSTREVEVGDRVKAGQIIGRVGNTGRSTAPHLHYEIKLNGDRIDPRPIVEIGLNIH